MIDFQPPTSKTIPRIAGTNEYISGVRLGK